MDPQGTHHCPRHGIQANTVVSLGQVLAASASIVYYSRTTQQQTYRVLQATCLSVSLVSRGRACSRLRLTFHLPCSFSHSRRLFLVLPPVIGRAR
ncbi:uncharacterized protein M421DRAFT_420539 [Didymella exigua CBS 183.55]|uniref:Uncharacterized protein n=1 Tax=Didymella exigua CBS 183.55 TaxID=1150837 RepID=A0A6A5RNP8_9PLEO|nr:uncharacterized protein M421DRAFT_420539 [Didymella exigua CBS 183.55]KAF1928654.1 hypothetical protein M421DRAFT_420539 [Didymella exigua CBS 183.55]